MSHIAFCSLGVPQERVSERDCGDGEDGVTIAIVLSSAITSSLESRSREMGLTLELLMAGDGVKDLNFKERCARGGYSAQRNHPAKDRANLNSFDNTSNLSQVARSVMNNFYDAICNTKTALLTVAA